MDWPEPTLCLRGVTKRFGARVAVDGLDLDVCPGEIFGLLGPNGAGKTTLVRMLCGLLAPDSGTITFAQVGIPRHQLVGVCPQDLLVWDQLTCFEQLVFMARMYQVPDKVAHRRADSLLQALGLDDRRNNPAGTLSGGMRRRLNLLLALMHDPEILLLDEPEAGLDPVSRVLLRDFIRSLRLTKTVILTSHNMDEVDRMADRVGIMNAGRLLCVDTPTALKTKAGKGDLLLVAMPEAEDRQRGAALLRSLRDDWQVQERPDGLALSMTRAVDSVADVVAALRSAELPVGALTIRENTLEDVFIALTGRSLDLASD